MGTHPLCGLLDCVSCLGLICVDSSTDGIAAELQLYAGDLVQKRTGLFAGCRAAGIAGPGVQPLLSTTNSLTRRRSSPAPLRSSLPPPTRRTVCTMSKKGAKTQDKDQSYEVRDIVLAKVRGFPPWPGMVSSSTFLSRSRVLYVPRLQ